MRDSAALKSASALSSRGLAHEFLRHEAPGALVLRARVRERGLRLANLGVARGHGLARGALVDAQDDGALLHAVTHVEADVDDPPRHLADTVDWRTASTTASAEVVRVDLAQLHRGGGEGSGAAFGAAGGPDVPQRRRRGRRRQGRKWRGSSFLRDHADAIQRSRVGRGPRAGGALRLAAFLHEEEGRDRAYREPSREVLR